MIQKTCSIAIVTFLLCLLAIPVHTKAQEMADKIIAVVGKNRIILQSDVELEAMQLRQQDPNYNDSSKCFILQQLIIKKMLVEQADRDSLIVPEEEVEGTLDNRLRYFVQQYGSKERMEEMAGKTIYQIKEEFRDGIKEQMTSEKVQGKILENVKITPAEISAFYSKLNADSLPFFPATVEVGQIVKDPPVQPEMDELAHKTLEDIRKKIVEEGKSFETEATINSDDPGSRDNGGRIDGVTRNGGFAPEFVAATFKLQNGDISPIFKTKFGYHIVQMISRKGDEADVRHILKKPNLVSSDFQKALNNLDSIRNLLVSGKMSFAEAVGKFSTDEAAKRTGGMIADPYTGNTILEMTKLDPAMVLLIDTMKVGNYSAPQIFITDMREKSCRIVYLRNRTQPHKANLREDYSKIMDVALGQKKTNTMIEWVKQKLPSIYLKIDPAYQTCSCFKDWHLNNETTAK